MQIWKIVKNVFSDTLTTHWMDEVLGLLLTPTYPRVSSAAPYRPCKFLAPATRKNWAALFSITHKRDRNNLDDESYRLFRKDASLCHPVLSSFSGWTYRC